VAYEYKKNMADPQILVEVSLFIVNSASALCTATYSYFSGKAHYVPCWLNHVPVRILFQADEMVSDLRDAFHDLLDENDWMDDVTRQSAAQKTDAMLVLSGFPSWCESSAELDKFYADVSRRLCSEGRLKSHPTTNSTVSYASLKKLTSDQTHMVQ
jgi:hypothetical protein